MGLAPIAKWLEVHPSLTSSMYGGPEKIWISVEMASTPSHSALILTEPELVKYREQVAQLVCELLGP